ncbi:hypothetical protein SDC9_33604 [bioreactor metagenome]|jgi:hypothetical protein|uniref:Uncharacterized protein n=1 Tax=bioreactor metagenome TaxID=1076179 RepID=A0A644VA13_9ZZZZ
MDINTFEKAKSLRHEIDIWRKEDEQLKDIHERGREDVVFNDLLNTLRTAIPALVECLEAQFKSL